MKYLKTLLLSAIVIVAIPTSAMTLWQYYNGQLPSIDVRSLIYKDLADDKYTGTAKQNEILLTHLQSIQDGGTGLVLGASLPQGVAVFQTSLLSAITSSASSMTLVANSVRGGSTLSGFNCFTIDEGSSISEYVCGTVSGTSVTSLTRGIDPLTGTTTNSSLQFAHRRGADVKVTDFPLIQIIKHQLNGAETFDNVLKYNTTAPACSGNDDICDKAYIDGVAVAGASNANETTKGIVELATAIQQASSTLTDTTGASLGLYSRYSTSSPVIGCNGTATVGALCNIIAQNDGKISPNFIGTSSAYTYNFGAKQNFNAHASSTGFSTGFFYAGESATTSISRTGVLTLATTTSGILKTSTAGVTYSSNSETAKFLGQTAGVSTTDSLTGATTTAINIPAGMLGVDGSVRITFRGSASDTAGSDNSDGFIRLNMGGTQFCTLSLTDIASAGSGDGEFWLFANGNASVYMYGQLNTHTQNGASAGQSTSCETTVATSTVTDNLTLSITAKLTDQNPADTEQITAGNAYSIFLGRQN